MRKEILYFRILIQIMPINLNLVFLRLKLF